MDDKPETKKEWITPDIADLDLDKTESGANGTTFEFGTYWYPS